MNGYLRLLVEFEYSADVRSACIRNYGSSRHRVTEKTVSAGQAVDLVRQAVAELTRLH